MKDLSVYVRAVEMTISKLNEEDFLGEKTIVLTPIQILELARECQLFCIEHIQSRGSAPPVHSTDTFIHILGPQPEQDNATINPIVDSSPSDKSDGHFYFREVVAKPRSGVYAEEVLKTYMYIPDPKSADIKVPVLPYVHIRPPKVVDKEAEAGTAVDVKEFPTAPVLLPDTPDIKDPKMISEEEIRDSANEDIQRRHWERKAILGSTRVVDSTSTLLEYDWNTEGSTNAVDFFVRDKEQGWISVDNFEKYFVYVLYLPGIKSANLEVNVNKYLLTISGDRDVDEPEENVKVKRGKLFLKVNLLANADLNNITAASMDGILKITVPKLPPPEPYKGRTIKVSYG